MFRDTYVHPRDDFYSTLHHLSFCFLVNSAVVFYSFNHMI